MPDQPLYNATHQSRSVPPTAYESLLGDAIERAFGQGIDSLDVLVAYLNQSGPSGPNGAAWTAESYTAEIAKLAT